MLLINPQRDRKEKLGEFAKFVPLNMPFGIGYLAGYMISKDRPVVVVDEEVSKVTPELLDKKTQGLTEPYIFGLSCLTANISRGIELAVLIKEHYPDSVIIFGGIHPTVLPDDVLDSGVADIVVLNEGEEILLKLYDAIKAGKDWRGIDGISYVKDGKHIHNKRARMVDMNEVPVFPFHLFEPYRDKYNFGFISTSRGCPYECIFCSQRAITGRTYRYITLENAIKTLDLMINKYDQKSILFTDDNFVVDKKRLIAICEAMVEHGFNKKADFVCQCRGDNIDEEILTQLKRAGCSLIAVGLETGSNRLMKLIKKAETVEDNIRGIKLAKKFGFKISGTFILGLPTETREERRMAYRLAVDLDLDAARFNNATPYPGTELYNIAIEEGRFNPGEGWKNLNACGTLVGSTADEMAYVPTTCTAEELMKDIFWFNVFFSLRPKKLFKLLFGKASDTAGWFFLGERWYLKWHNWSVLLKFSAGFLMKCVRMTFIRTKKSARTLENAAHNRKASP